MLRVIELALLVLLRAGDERLRRRLRRMRRHLDVALLGCLVRDIARHRQSHLRLRLLDDLLLLAWRGILLHDG